MELVDPPHVVIVGGGFAGLTAARGLKHSPVRVTLVDQSNHHLFQPLLYQVATGTLSPGDIATPIRAILGKQKNSEVILSKVTGVDPLTRQVFLCEGQRIEYDYLVLATGARHSYFAHPEWEKDALGLKSINDAAAICQRLLTAFELAEIEPDREKRDALLTFITVGGGPTGVELTGALAEISNHVLRRDYRHIHPGAARFILVEAGPRILAAFSKESAARARYRLEKHGVRILTGMRVENVDEAGVTVGGERISARNVLWAAGVVASPAAKWLGVEADKAGRTKVLSDLSVPGHSEIFVIGDAAKLEQGGKALPGLAPVALQQGRYVAKVISDRIHGREIRRPFHYVDKGNLATVGRTFAIAEFNEGRIRVSGAVAKIIWAFVHIFFLVGFQSRVAVMAEWLWTLISFQGASRLIVPNDREVCADEVDRTRKAG